MEEEPKVNDGVKDPGKQKKKKVKSMTVAGVVMSKDPSIKTLFWRPKAKIKDVEGISLSQKLRGVICLLWKLSRRAIRLVII